MGSIEPTERRSSESYYLLCELIKNQLSDVPVAKKLQVKDMERIAGNLHTSVFNPSTCCLWCAYVSNLRRPHKGVSVQFFFNGKKQSLHRLLFINYVSSSLNQNSYLKRKCRNCSCVNVNHYYSMPYLKERKPPKATKSPVGGDVVKKWVQCKPSPPLTFNLNFS